MKILLAADGSEYTRRAAEHVARHVSWLREAPEIHVLHVRPPLPYPGAAAHVGAAAIEKYEREESEAALRVAEKVFHDAGIAFESLWCVGEVAERIADYAEKRGIDLVVVGSHGHGALANLALGSVATRLIATLGRPVLVVR